VSNPIPHAPLTRRQCEVLEIMAADPDGDDGELVYESGAGGWIGLDRVAPRTVFALIRACAISLEGGGLGGDGSVERYRINETGRQLIA
jgi:hypothetical protein